MEIKYACGPVGAFRKVRRYLLRKRAKFQRKCLLNQIRRGLEGKPIPTPSNPKRRKFSFAVDILGVCNLKCPSCPTGNWGAAPNPKGLMTPEMLSQIMDKAQRECEVSSVSLYNWTEPVLHPRVSEMIQIVQGRGVPCTISSNMNLVKNIDDIMRAEPYQFHISVSGFTQETYGRTHRGGQIDRVKENMAALYQSRKRTRSKTYVKVIFHRYLRNLDDEIRMKEFSEDLGFRFEPNWALFLPLEKSLAYMDPKATGAAPTEDDRRLIEELALDLKSAFAVAQQYKSRRCDMQDSLITIDCEGSVQLCCGVYDSTKYSLGKYLSAPLDDLQRGKYKSSMCGTCMKLGGHVYLSPIPEFDEIGHARRNPAGAAAIRMIP